MGRKTMDPRSCTSYHCKAYNHPCGITCILSEFVSESESLLYYKLHATGNSSVVLHTILQLTLHGFTRAGRVCLLTQHGKHYKPISQ
jgi:hypothetical protein